MSETRLETLLFNPKDVWPAVYCTLRSEGRRPAAHTVGCIEHRGFGFLLYEEHGGSVRFTVDARRTADELAAELERGYRLLGQVRPAQSGDGKQSLVLTIVRFKCMKKIPPISIIVNEKMLEKMKRNRILPPKAKDVTPLASFLELVVPGEGESYALVACYVPGKREEEAVNEQLRKETAEAEAPKEAVVADDPPTASGGEATAAETGAADETGNEDAGEEEAPEGDAAASLSKDRWMMAVLNHRIESVQKLVFLGYGWNHVPFSLTVGAYAWPNADAPEKYVLLTERVKIREKKEYLPCMMLGRVKMTVTTEQVTSSALLSRMMDAKDAYLSVWETYLETEKDILFEKVRSIGILPYDPPVVAAAPENVWDRDFYDLPIRGRSGEALQHLRKKDLLCASEHAPAYLSDPTMTRKEYEALSKEKQKGIILQIEEIDRANQILTVSIPREKHANIQAGLGLYYLDIGDKMQMERREDAQHAIHEGTSANPRLGMIIGAGDTDLDATELFGDQEKRPEIPALSPLVNEKIFTRGGRPAPPTPTQERAIQMALNTPDIAIIQGPPGTGKTTVITAIVERLNELADKAKARPGQVLLTSLQHDAVYNVIERLRINSLPTIKFGKRRAEDPTMEDAVDRWRMALAEKLDAKLPEETERDRKIARAYRIYSLRPSRKNAHEYLRAVEPFAASEDLRAQCRALKSRYEAARAQDAQELLPAICRLRTTKRSFADDGGVAAQRLRAQLLEAGFGGSGQEEAILQTLRAAARLGRRGDALTPELRDQLRTCKAELLARCLPQPHYETEELDEAIVTFHADLERYLRRPQDAMAGALYDFYCALEDDPVNVNRAIANYAFPYAATAQQSMEKSLVEKKGAHPVYDTVIVDEAARVPPPDLLIPLSQAQHRIILVGDHRQLPHMYDEEVFSRMEEAGEHIAEEDVERSLFEVLLDRAKKLEALDHRRRFITLDMQYRMHPALGDFVSENFYEPFGEQFDSGLPAEAFTQSFERAPLLWLDVREGPMESAPAGSRYRPAEITAIVDKIRAYREHMQAPEATDAERRAKIGVISFYSEQVRRIKDRLRKSDLASVLEAGDIQVGTVDSFQGREYDIIFLSIVREGLAKHREELRPLLKKLKDARTEEEARAIDRAATSSYGFLRVRNRLCVAMSRQKMLLVVVGSSKILAKDVEAMLAEEYIPALKNFYERCEEEGMVERVKL